MTNLKLLRRLKDRNFRRAFAEEAVDVGVPVQIREMRRARGWTQKQLGEIAGVAQESVARAESMSYGRFALATLKNFAAAFDCVLIVRFASFSELLEWKRQIDEAAVTPADYATDYALHNSANAMAVASSGHAVSTIAADLAMYITFQSSISASKSASPNLRLPSGISQQQEEIDARQDASLLSDSVRIYQKTLTSRTTLLDTWPHTSQLGIGSHGGLNYDRDSTMETSSLGWAKEQ